MINNSSKLAQTFWKQGFSEACPVIDFHAHMNPMPGGYLPEDTADKMYAKMLRCNTRLMLFCGHEALFAPYSNHRVDIEAVSKHPDRMRAYFAMNGSSPDLKADYERFINRQDVFVGLKTLPDYFHYGISDEIYKPFYKYANTNRLLFLCHTWGGSKYNGIEEAVKVLEEYPNMIFIAGHSFHGRWEEAAELCNTYENLYLELTAVIDEIGPLEYLLKTCGSEKILFGTDLPWFDTLHGIGYILSTEMSDSDRENIFFRNGVRLLQSCEWFKKLWGWK
ncbi:MAG: amidohydrolase family protein [Victivallales bacterium]|nr:amidohydrolase family protein [Victivallales bacterium]